MKTLRLIALLSFVLLATCVNAQTGEIFYNPKHIDVDKNSAKTTLAELIKYTNWGKPDDITVLDDRIEFSFNGKKKTVKKELIYFSEMGSDPVSVTRKEITPVNKKSINATITYYDYSISLKNCRLHPKNVIDAFFYKDDLPAPSFTFGDVYHKQNIAETEANYKKLADYLYFFQRPFLTDKYESLLNQFKPVAEQYRALTVKLPISEEQRKYIVQANALSEEKDYVSAISMYNKVIAMDPVAYPAAYSNLALLTAATKNYEGAIFYMKEYLLLEPESSDARSAQDKIYEWEIKIPK